MIVSAAGCETDRSGRNELWGAILRLLFVRAVVLWPRVAVSGSLEVQLGLERRLAIGLRRERASMVKEAGRGADKVR